MTDTDVGRRRRWSGAVIALFLGAVGTLAWLATRVESSSAAFADQEIFDRNHLGAATLDIAIGDDTVRFAASGMAAGDTATGRLELVNNGTLPLRYRLSASTNGGPLGAALQLAAWSGGPGCSAKPPTDALWRPLADLGGPAEAPSLGRLAPGESDLLCLAGSLPLSAPSSVQGSKLTLDFTVHAEHDIGAAS